MSDKIGQYVVIGANVNRTFLTSVADGIDHIAFLLRNYGRTTTKTKKFFIVQIVKEVSLADALMVRGQFGNESVRFVAPKEPEVPNCTFNCECGCHGSALEPSPARDYGRDDILGCRYSYMEHHCSPSCGGVPHDAVRVRTALPSNSSPVPGWTWQRGNRYYFVSEYSLRKAKFNGNKPWVRNQTVRF